MPALALHNVYLNSLLSDITLTLNAGMQALFITSSDHENRVLLQLLSGGLLPDHGQVTLLDNDTKDLDRQQLQQIRSKIGTVTASGGLLSNLKLWENIALPQYYSHGVISPEMTEKISAYLERFGYCGNLMALPAHLSLFDRRMAAFIRAAINAPGLMLYAGCFDSLTTEQRHILLNQSEELRRSQPEQASVFITSSITALEELKPDIVINLRSEKIQTSRHS